MNKLYQRIASAVAARANCIEAHNIEWCDKHEETILSLVRQHMPSGSGVDSGTKIDLDKSGKEKLVFYAGYHHMNDCGMYDGWTEHSVIVTPSFDGIDLKVTGHDRNDIKDYLGDLFHYALAAEV